MYWPSPDFSRDLLDAVLGLGMHGVSQIGAVERLLEEVARGDLQQRAKHRAK